jgi:hypothetical protein
MSELVYRTIKEAEVSAPPPELTAPVTADGTTEKNIVFGIVFKLRDREVRITTADIADPMKNGIDLRLPEPVVLGTIKDIFKWFEEQFGVTLPDGSTFPFPLDEVFLMITELVWTVDAVHVYVPGNKKADADEPSTYTLIVSAEWPEKGIPLIPGVLEIKGAVFGLTNEPPQSA